MSTMVMMRILHVDDDDDDFACPTQAMTLRGCELLRAIQLETPLLYTLLLLQYKDDDDDDDEEEEEEDDDHNADVNVHRLNEGARRRKE